MQALVIYDSAFGNTEQIARAIGEALEERFTVEVVRAAEAKVPPANVDLLVVGGPTQGHGASPDMKALLGSIGRGTLRNVRAAAFDTRFKMARWLSGSAAGVIARQLKQAGCEIVAPPESFFVARDQKGPLLPGELERARDWSQSVLATLAVGAKEAVSAE